MDCCITIKKIIFATDFSAGAEAAFMQALDAGLTHGAELLLVHVLPPLTQPVPLLNELAMGDVPPQVKEDIKNAAIDELRKLYAEKCVALPKVSIALLEGDPAKALADFAAAQNADLVVVGSTGLSGLAKAMFGSVAAKVVQKAPCSVLVVRRKK
jgi:nucleotide-binding universal stress UspA family protein